MADMNADAIIEAAHACAEHGVTACNACTPVESGYSRLWGWFGLSYASFLTIPRVLMHDMPDEWQGKMADLLAEYEAAFPNLPNIGTSVSGTRNGKFVHIPDWLKRYRHPDRCALTTARGIDLTHIEGSETP
jgi:hypothetical protein